MTFQTLYDIRTAGCRDGFLPFVFMAVAVLFLLGRVIRPPAVATYLSNIFRRPQPSPMAGFTFAMALALLAFIVTWVSYWSLLADLKTGRVEQVVGPVAQFRPAANYKALESFSVDGRTFSYRETAVAQGFHTLRLRGSPLRDGSMVRVVFVGNHILELDLAR